MDKCNDFRTLCEKCGKTYSRRDAFARHMKKNHNENCGATNDLMSKQSKEEVSIFPAKKKISSNNKRKRAAKDGWQCTVCDNDREYSLEQMLARHSFDEMRKEITAGASRDITDTNPSTILSIMFCRNTNFVECLRHRTSQPLTITFHVFFNLERIRCVFESCHQLAPAEDAGEWFDNDVLPALLGELKKRAGPSADIESMNISYGNEELHRRMILDSCSERSASPLFGRDQPGFRNM